MRVGVVGVGAMGQNHVRVLADLTDLVGVVDSSREGGTAVAKRFHVPYFPSIKGLVEAGAEAATVATPTETHRAVASELLDAGIHTLVEKPFTGRASDAEALALKARDQGVTLAVGMVERHNPVVAHARRALRGGDFGRLLTLASRRVSSFPSRVRDVGVILDLGIHDIDVMRHLAGDVESVYALGGRHRHERFEDYADLLLTFAGGEVGFIEVNWLTPMKVRRLALTCERNFVEMDYTAQTVTVSSATLGELDLANLYRAPFEYHVQTVQVKREEPLVRELRDFLEAIEERRPPLVTAGDALQTLQVAEACVDSQRRGRRVDILTQGLP